MASAKTMKAVTAMSEGHESDEVWGGEAVSPVAIVVGREEAAAGSTPEEPPAKKAKAEEVEEAKKEEIASGLDKDLLSPISISSVLWCILWILGAAFEGFALTKCLVPYPKVLADQFIFANAIVLKVFIAGVGSSMVTGAIMATLAPAQWQKSRYYVTNRFGYGRVVLGTLILGAGMAIGGSGPTIYGPAIGAQVETAWALVAGALGAELLVSLLDKAFVHVTAKPQEVESLRAEQVRTVPWIQMRSAEQVIGRAAGKTVGYVPVAAMGGFFMVAATFVLEVLVNFKEDASKYGGVLSQPYPDSIFQYPAWPPIIAGCAMGIAQVPSRMVTADGLGGGTTFVVVISTLSCGKLNPGNALFDSLVNTRQIVFTYVFALAGGLLAVLSNGSYGIDDTTQPLTAGFHPARMALGAFLGIGGSRIAGGCTCGHGISGTSDLSLESFVGACTIFGGAILTRCILVFALEVNY